MFEENGIQEVVMMCFVGISQLLKQTNSAPMDVGARVRSYLAMMDSMTQTELDDNKAFENKKTRDSRLARIAHGSGHTLREVNGLLEQFKHFQAMFKRGQLPIARNAGQLSKFLPHHLIQQINAIEKQQVRQSHEFCALVRYSLFLGWQDLESVRLANYNMFNACSFQSNHNHKTKNHLKEAIHFYFFSVQQREFGGGE